MFVRCWQANVTIFTEVKLYFELSRKLLYWVCYQWYETLDFNMPNVMCNIPCPVKTVSLCFPCEFNAHNLQACIIRVCTITIILQIPPSFKLQSCPKRKIPPLSKYHFCANTTIDQIPPVFNNYYCPNNTYFNNHYC